MEATSAQGADGRDSRTRLKIVFRPSYFPGDRRNYAVLILLRDFAQSIDLSAPPTPRVVWDFITHDLASKNAADAAPVLKSLLERGRLLLLFDGLDEVPQERRAFVRDALERFSAASAPANRFIVTCRILSYADPAYQLAGFEAQTIAPLDEDQIATFIATWYTALTALNAMDSATAAERMGDLGEALRGQGLLELAANPMLLTVMALVQNHLGTLPRETARLYSQCVDLLLLKWRPLDARALIDLLEIREDDLLRLVWEIAFDAHDQQAEREGTADIEQHVVEQIARNRLNDDAAKAQAFCEYIERRAGLLIGRGFNRYGGRIYTFPHRTFQEFLAGCHISVNRFTRQAETLARRGAGWRETLLLATGNLVFNQRNIDTPVDAVSAMLTSASPRHDDDDWRLYPLAGEMLLLVGLDNLEKDDVGRRALADARNGLAALVGEGHLPPIERAAAGRVLSVLGDPRPGVGLRPEGVPDIVWCDVPAGDFIMGSDDDYNYEKPRRIMRLEHIYQIAQYPVTYVQFQAFVDSGSYDDPAWWRDLAADGDDKHVQEQAFKFANHPRETVNWYQAVAFTRWLSAKLDMNIRLPTEFEWERAARGTDGRTYPYGDVFDAAKGNTYDTGVGQTSAVGLFPDGGSPVGALDLSGNVWEWCLSAYEKPAPDAHAENINSKDRRVYRGSSWKNDEILARATYRAPRNPDQYGNPLGFRVGRFA